MKKTFIAFNILISFSMARPIFTLTPYHSYTKYSDKYKDDSNAIGIYSSIYNYPYKFEFSSEYTNIKFKNSTPKFEQTEMTFVSSYFINENLFIKAGLHFVASDYRPSNEGLATIISGVDYKHLNTNYGLELFYSNYKNYSPKSLNILQLHPYFTYHFANTGNKFGSFNLKADYTYIKPKDAYLYQNQGIKSSYSSFGLKLSNNNGNWRTSIAGWLGHRAFALNDGGFTLYNLSQIYLGGLAVNIDYSIKNRAYIGLGYNYKLYKNYAKKGHSNSVNTSFSYKW